MFERPLPELFVVGHHGLVLARVELDVEDVSRLALADAARDPDRLAGGELAVHGRRRDSDPLLAARLLESVKFRSVEQLSEDLRYLCFDDPGTIVLYGDSKPVFCELPDVDP